MSNFMQTDRTNSRIGATKPENGGQSKTLAMTKSTNVITKKSTKFYK